MKKIFGLIGRIFIIGLLSALIGYDIYLFNATYVCNDVLPMPFGTGTAVIMSGSMEPEISVYDFIIVRKSENYVLNDIVTFVENGKLVTHRIVEQKEDVFVTRGDVNNTEDPAISKNEILGKVVKVVPGVGRITLFLQKPIGMLCLMMLLLGGMELSFRRTKSKKRKQVELVRAELEELKREVEQISITDVKVIAKTDDEIMVREQSESKIWIPEKIEKEPEVISFNAEDDFDLDINDYDDYDSELNTKDCIAVSEDSEYIHEKNNITEVATLSDVDKENIASENLTEKCEETEQEKVKLIDQETEQELEKTGIVESDKREMEEIVKDAVKSCFQDEVKTFLSQQMKEILEAEIQKSTNQVLEFENKREKRQQENNEKRLERKKNRIEKIKKAKKMIRSISWKAMTLIILLLVIIIVNIVSLTTQKSGKPFTIFGFYMVMIESNSMEPAIQVNDVVILEKLDVYQPGEVITYMDHGDLITHRIQGITENGYLTKGDANISSDQTIVSSENVIGKVIKVNSFLGLLIQVLLSPYIFGFIIAVLIIYAVREHRKGAYVERKVM